MSYNFLKRDIFNLDLKRSTSEQARISKGLIDGKILKYLQDNRDRSHSMF